MRTALIAIGSVGCVFALYLWHSYYCYAGFVSISTEIAIQRLVLQQILDKNESCLCPEIRVGYRFRRRDGFLATHAAYFDVSKKTLRIETDLGSGWAFGWDGIDEQVIKQVLRDGGQFSKFTEYRPRGRHIPLQLSE